MSDAYDTLIERVAAEDRDAAILLTKNGGIRAVFDSGSAEFAGMTPEARLKWLDTAYRFGATLGELRRAFIVIMGKYNYPNLLALEEFERSCAIVLAQVLRERHRDPLRKLAEQGE